MEFLLYGVRVFGVLEREGGGVLEVVEEECWFGGDFYVFARVVCFDHAL